MKLDPVVQGFPPYLRAGAAASYAAQTTSQIVMTSPLVLRVPHCVSSVALKAKTQHLSAVRAMTYDFVSSQAKNVVIERCPTLNIASLMPISDDGEKQQRGSDDKNCYFPDRLKGHSVAKPRNDSLCGWLINKSS